MIDFARTIQCTVPDKTYRELQIVKTVLGVPQYEFLAHAVNKTVQGHLKSMRKNRHVLDRGALPAAERKVEQRLKRRKTRSAKLHDWWDLWLAEQRRDDKAKRRIEKWVASVGT